MNHHRSPAAQPEAIDTCLIFELCDLITATARLDEKPRNPHQATKELIAVAYRVAAAAGPILDGEAALITALREAAAARPNIPPSCPNCQKLDGGRCGRHATSSTVAETYHDLGHALSGPSYTALDTSPGPTSDAPSRS